MGKRQSQGAGPGALSESLRAWIRLHIPGVGEPNRIRFHPCRRIPFWWIPGNRNVEGLTLWRNIYLRHSRWPIDPNDSWAIELLFHELIHVEQFRQAPVWFPIKYLLSHIRFGYHNNPAEREARRRAAQLTRMFFAEPLSYFSSQK